MTSGANESRIEYPDAAGYPDGTGTLDEGTAALIDEVTAQALQDVDTPSAETDVEIEVHRLDERRVYSATLGDREIAAIRYDEDGDRVIVLSTTVDPDFRGRGIAADLIADALDDIRDRGMRVVTRCRVVAAFLANNVQYADLAD